MTRLDDDFDEEAYVTKALYDLPGFSDLVDEIMTVALDNDNPLDSIVCVLGTEEEPIFHKINLWIRENWG